MKKLLVVALCLGSISSFAEENGDKFEERKSRMMSHLDERISHLQKAKSCVSQASDKDAMKKCHQILKEQRKEMKDGWKTKQGRGNIP